MFFQKTRRKSTRSIVLSPAMRWHADTLLSPTTKSTSGRSGISPGKTGASPPKLSAGFPAVALVQVVQKRRGALGRESGRQTRGLMAREFGPEDGPTHVSGFWC